MGNCTCREMKHALIARATSNLSIKFSVYQKPFCRVQFASCLSAIQNVKESISQRQMFKTSAGMFNKDIGNVNKQVRLFCLPLIYHHHPLGQIRRRIPKI